MKYYYSNPNLNFSVFLKALFGNSKNSEFKIKQYFSTLTGKKYILITNSCRSALFLAFQAIKVKGEVITSPLTCKVAIDPIKESDNIPIFSDVNTSDLNINTKDIENRISNKTIAIQAIHMGGISCKMDHIRKITKNYNLWLIEDCAQSLGTKYNGQYTGSFGDIACFSLSKNAYGIGGGILATNSKKIYTQVSSKLKTLGYEKKSVIYIRILRNILETYRNKPCGSILYNLFLKLKGNRKRYTNIKSQLKQISPCQLKINYLQILRSKELHNKRKTIGELYYKLLNKNHLMINNNYDPKVSSFTKIFLYHPKINTIDTIKKLHKMKIEAMHLEHKLGSPYQQKLINEKTASNLGLKQYLKIHDHVISLPLQEEFNNKDIIYITDSLKK